MSTSIEEFNKAFGPRTFLDRFFEQNMLKYPRLKKVSSPNDAVTVFELNTAGYIVNQSELDFNEMTKKMCLTLWYYDDDQKCAQKICTTFSTKPCIQKDNISAERQGHIIRIIITEPENTATANTSIPIKNVS